jgi:hypothetical protein
MDEKNPFEFAFGARDVFLTGTTGMLGTALLIKITKDTTISQIHILVRGGEGTYLNDDIMPDYWVVLTHTNSSILASHG